jgi:hypothetical protein
MTSLKDGGTMIDYDEEDPEIRIRFEQSLEKNGIPRVAQPIGSA